MSYATLECWRKKGLLTGYSVGTKVKYMEQDVKELLTPKPKRMTMAATFENMPVDIPRHTAPPFRSKVHHHSDPYYTTNLGLVYQ